MKPAAVIFKFLPDKVKLPAVNSWLMPLGHHGNKTLLLCCVFYDLYYANQNAEEYGAATTDLSINVDR